MSHFKSLYFLLCALGTLPIQATTPPVNQGTQKNNSENGRVLPLVVVGASALAIVLTLFYLFPRNAPEQWEGNSSPPPPQLPPLLRPGSSATEPDLSRMAPGRNENPLTRVPPPPLPLQKPEVIPPIRKEPVVEEESEFDKKLHREQEARKKEVEEVNPSEYLAIHDKESKPKFPYEKAIESQAVKEYEKKVKGVLSKKEYIEWKAFIKEVWEVYLLRTPGELQEIFSSVSPRWGYFDEGTAKEKNYVWEANNLNSLAFHNKIKGAIKQKKYKDVNIVPVHLFIGSDNLDRTVELQQAALKKSEKYFLESQEVRSDLLRVFKMEHVSSRQNLEIVHKKWSSLFLASTSGTLFTEDSGGNIKVPTRDFVYHLFSRYVSFFDRKPFRFSAEMYQHFCDIGSTCSFPSSLPEEQRNCQIVEEGGKKRVVFSFPAPGNSSNPFWVLTPQNRFAWPPKTPFK